LLLFLGKPAPHKGEDDAAGDVACGDDQQTDHGIEAPDASHGKIEHVCNAVFIAADDEDHDAEKHSQIFANFVGVVFVALHADVDENVAEDAQNEEAQIAVVQLGFAHGRGFFRKGSDAACPDAEGHQTGTHQVAQPDDRDVPCVVFVILEDVADLSREQVQAEGADAEEAAGEEKGPEDLVVEGQEGDATESDAGSSQNGRDKCFETLHEGILS